MIVNVVLCGIGHFYHIRFSDPVADRSFVENVSCGALARGFVYVVSVLGTTGGTVDLADSVTNTLSRAREAFGIPLALGFGLKDPSQLDVLPSDMRPDAAVFGSALLRHIEEGKPVSSFLAPWL